MYYSYAKLSRLDFGTVRFFGAGLGNLLFPWARWIVTTQKYGLVPIAPTWLQLKVGPVLRKEPDKRFYNGLFCKSIDYIHGLKKLYLLCKLPSIEEEEFLKGYIYKTKRQKGIVIFQGMDHFFKQILKNHYLVNKELIDMTLEKHKNGLTYNFQQSISAHIRLGDFKIGRQTTPLSWFVNTITKLREKLDGIVPVYVFSDGHNNELKPVLCLPNTYRLSFGSGIADMLALSRATILIASANSTFDMWASYLGRMPVIWPLGGLQQQLYYERPQSEITYGGEKELPISFLNACRKKFKNSATF